MKTINQQLNVEADDVIWLGFGPKESLVSLKSYLLEHLQMLLKISS